MAIYVVRHACAGHKEDWSGPDEERPLDAAGRAQALALATHLEGAGLRRVVTSPTRRCLETVARIATAGRLPILRRPDLTSPRSGAHYVARLLDAGRGDGSLVCTHGEVLRPALDLLRRRPVTVVGDPSDEELLAKGGVWVLRNDGSVWSLELDDTVSLHTCPQHDPPAVEGREEPGTPTARARRPPRPGAPR